MNIFALDNNPKKAAQMMCDKHIVKMIIESFQMFSSVIDTNYDPAKISDDDHLRPSERLGMYGYPKSVAKHPCTKWIALSCGNYKWMLKHTRAMIIEYSRRYGKVHASEGMLMIVEGQMEHLMFAQERKTKFVQAMPDKVKDKDPVRGYRNYYNMYKFPFARWKRSICPDWFVGGPLYFVSLEKNSAESPFLVDF